MKEHLNYAIENLKIALKCVPESDDAHMSISDAILNIEDALQESDVSDTDGDAEYINQHKLQHRELL